MDFRIYLEKTIGRYKALQPRYKKLVDLLIIAILINLFFTHIYTKQARLRNSLKKEFYSLDNHFTELRSQFPDLEKERKFITEQKRNVEVLQERLKQQEETFPTQARVPQLLAKLIENGKGKIDFASIVPKSSKKDKELYSHLDIEMIVRSSYMDLSNYVYRLERLPELVVISDLNLEKKIDAGNEYIEAKIILSTLLTKEEEIERPKETVSSADLTEPLITKDPFTSKEKTTEEAEILAGLKLTGIIFRNEKSCAIINNNVYKVGDKIGDKTISEIFKDKVMITDGENTYKLELAK